MNNDTCRPREHLKAAAYLYPGAWKQIDYFRSERGKKGLADWPRWCFCPMAASYAIVSGGGSNRCSPKQIMDVARIAALAAWRVTQGIYRFDPAVYEQLITTPIGKLPVEVLYSLPEWCVYVETPGLPIANESGLTDLPGFFAHLEHDVNTGRPELRLLLDVDYKGSPVLWPVPLHLDHDTLQEAIQAAFDEASRHAINEGYTDLLSLVPEADAEMTNRIAPFVSLLLYLCSESADFGDRPAPKYPKPAKTKKGWKLFPPSQPIIWPVGVRIGAALRKANLAAETGGISIIPESGRTSPRPHVRRAHWHLYWTGAGREIPQIKWIHPIAVNVDNPEDLPAIIRKVAGNA